MLERFLSSVFGDGSAPLTETAGERRLAELVASIPVPLRQPLSARAPGLLATADVFRRMLDAANRSVKIFSPYVDPTFTGFAQATKVPIQVVTTLREGRMKSSPVLKRYATTHPLAVRYLHENRAKSKMFQLHAKMILVDSTMAYIGSANFTDTSLHYNFELGLYVEDGEVIGPLHTKFDKNINIAAGPAAQK